MSDIFDLFKKIETNKAPSSAQPISFMLVGLGNPGNEYRLTRHNTGFLMLDYVCERAGVTLKAAKYKALTGEGLLNGLRVLFVKPQTYMNLSGEAVLQAASFYKLPLERILVFSDDISLPVGRMRVRRSGSDGGQKGLRNIIERMGSDAFPRMRFGVGEKPHPDYPLADWVLSTFNKEEQNQLFACFEKGYEGVLSILAGDIDGAMLKCNTK